MLLLLLLMMRTTTIILYFQQQQSQKFTKICILQKKRFEQLQSYSPCKKSFSYPTNIKFCISFMFKNPSFTHLLVLFLYPPILSFLFLIFFFYIYIVIVQKTGLWCSLNVGFFSEHHFSLVFVVHIIEIQQQKNNEIHFTLICEQQQQQQKIPHYHIKIN